jgi:transcriptional regulator with XRE-family HTH domain
MLQVVSIKAIKLRIGQLVRLLRKRDGLTQQQLAEKLGLSRITVKNLELGQNATLDTLFKALQYFDMLEELDRYFTGETEKRKYKSLY